MVDGIKILDLSVSTDTLLRNPSLDFQGRYSRTTGELKTDQLRATDRGLTFALIPRQTGRADADTYRVELSGSIHRYHNDGIHNADDFTTTNLLATVDQLVTTYGIDPFTSQLNNVEFGVNVRLPFPVGQVLDNLISYKNRAFSTDTKSATPYYQCQFQQYVLKLYDKGRQFGLSDYLLRVEVKVLKMEYLTRRVRYGRSAGAGPVHLNTLADLLNMANYGPLGALLVDTFNEILFDEPTIKTAALTDRERNIYQNGRNPRFWLVRDGLTGKEYERHRKGLQRAETKYRALLNQHRRGNDWQRQTAALISETWQRLTTVAPDLLTAISDRRTAWRNLTKPHIQPVQILTNNTVKIPLNTPVICPELTGGTGAIYNEKTTTKAVEPCPKLTDSVFPLCGSFQGITTPVTTARSESDLSPINPLYLGLNQDMIPIDTIPESAGIVCPVTGVKIANPSGRQRFVSTAMLRTDDRLLTELTRRFTYYRNGSKEDEPTRTAHNVRNVHSNPRNNLRRAILKVHRQPTLFDVEPTLRLTSDQRVALDYWQGTPYEVPVLST